MQRVYHLHDLVGEAVELSGGEPPDGGDPGQHVEQALLRHVRRSDVQLLPKLYFMRRSTLSEEGILAVSIVSVSVWGVGTAKELYRVSHLDV